MSQPINPYAKIKPSKKKVGPDKAPIGFLLGLLFPFIGVLLLYFVWGKGVSIGDYLSNFWATSSPLKMDACAKILSLSLLLNLLPFYFFINRKQYSIIRGILMAMFLLAIIIVLYKLVWQ
jgi:hypothetical protein